MTMPVYQIGASEAGMASLSSLGLPLPQAEAVDYATYVENGSGELVGQGWIVARWRFHGLTVAQVAILEAFEGTCYIQTLEMDDSYGRYSALLVLPPRKSSKAGVVEDYVAEFRKLVAL